MTTEKKINLIDRAIDELEMALQDAKDSRDDIETGSFAGCSIFHAGEAVRLLKELG